jgi:hypothetical protein
MIMKHLNLFFIFFILVVFRLEAQQVPGRINYQTILRDLSNNEPLINTTVALRFTILQDDANGTQIYKEQHFGKTTNQFGLITLAIGTGDPVFGIFSQIDWSTGLKFVKIEVDITGSGNAWQNFGTTQFISVPYAFVAQSAQTLSPMGAQTGQVLEWNGTAWVPGLDNAAGSYVEGPGIDITSTIISLDPQGASNGQVLKFNGTSWVPGPDNTGSGSDNWGSQVAQTNPTISGNGTVGNPLSIATQGAIDGQVLRFNGTTWVPGNVSGPSDNWGTQVVQTTATLSGNGTTNNPLSLATQGAINGQVLKYNGTTWAPGPDNGTPDNWGTQVTQTNSTLSGNGTAASPLSIASQGAANGQVLKWNGIAWVPGPDNNSEPDNWGTQVVQIASTLSGNGTITNPIGLAAQGATNGQVLKWNGATWLPGDDVVGADNWGGQVTQTSSVLSGNGTVASPLTIATQGAINGQVLKFNGTTWVPGDVTGGAADNWGTQVAQTTATISGNGTVANPLAIAPQGAVNGQILKFNGTTWVPGPDNTGTDNWGTQVAQTTATISGNGTVANPLAIAPQGAINGQVLKFNGSSWVPGPDNNSGPDNWGGQVVETGNALTGFGIAGSPLNLATQGASNGQVLKFNGSSWVPGPDNTGSGTSQWLNNGTKIYYNTNNVGVGTTDPQSKLQVLAGGGTNNAIIGETSNSPGTGVIGRGIASTPPPSNFNIGVYGSGITGVIGSGSDGVAGLSTSAGGTGVYGETTSSSTGVANAIYGIGYGQNDNGVYGQADASNGFGVYGYSSNGYGVVGVSESNSSSNGYGIWGINDNPTGYAGYFNGRVNVVGMLSKSGGTFKIDHPLDPENKYLYHSFVESPDMMNIYNGNIVTDGQGLATIQLPEYFEALNKDFRYQLTPIGDFCQVVVREKVKNNEFVIQTDKPGVEVSWQVTGIRKDRFADANRVIPEVEKSAEEKGKYLHPTLFGQRPEQGIGFDNIKPASNRRPYLSSPPQAKN